MLQVFRKLFKVFIKFIKVVCIPIFDFNIHKNDYGDNHKADRKFHVVEFFLILHLLNLNISFSLCIYLYACVRRALLQWILI